MRPGRFWESAVGPALLPRLDSSHCPGIGQWLISHVGLLNQLGAIMQMRAGGWGNWVAGGLGLNQGLRIQPCG